MQRDREAQARKWDEQNRKWDEQSREQARKWEEHNREQALKWDEQNRKWDEQNRKWDEQNRKWDEVHAELRREREEQARKWDEVYAELGRDREEQARKWDASQREFDRVHDEIMAEAKKVDRSIGALGARWGMQSEAAFRNALAGILEQHFGVQVLHVDDYDDDGTVFGRPDQVEIDIIIKNGLLLICELKSSMSKSDMYIFERKARFYERHHDRNADRLLVISPMIDAKAKKVAHQIGHRDLQRLRGRGRDLTVTAPANIEQAL
jgi:hypothetical protein